MEYGPPADQKTPASQPWAAGSEVGAEFPAKNTKLEPDEAIAAQTDFLAGGTGHVITASGATLSHSTTIAGAESRQPVADEAREPFTREHRRGRRVPRRGRVSGGH